MKKPPAKAEPSGGSKPKGGATAAPKGGAGGGAKSKGKGGGAMGKFDEPPDVSEPSLTVRTKGS